MKLRVPLVLLAALAALAIPAGSALATPVAVFVLPGNLAFISQNQTLSVDTNGIAGAVGVDFYVDGGSGDPAIGGRSVGGYTAHAANPTSAQGVRYSSVGNVASYQLAIGGWALPSDPTDLTTPYSITFDAAIVDINSNTLAVIQRTVTIANTQTPLVRGSFTPSSSTVKSGTIALSITPSDQNNVITAGTFSVDFGETTYPLTDNHDGTWSAPVDTVALGVPNGGLDIQVHLQDAAGNMSDTHIGYTIANPHAPTITPNTLVAQKAMYRTDETQLEVGDIVGAYGMRADGYPAPTISYTWNLCRGEICTAVTADADGSYTVQPADEGAALSLTAKATNDSGSAPQTVEFGVIAPAYVYPVFVCDASCDGPQFGDAPAPTPEPPVVVPPVVVPPVVVSPVVTPPLITPTEQRIINIAQKTVETKTAAVETAKKAVDVATKTVKTVQKKVDATLKAVSAGTATPTEQKKLTATVATLVTVKNVANAKVQEAKVNAENAVKAKNASIQKTDAALKAVVAAKTAVDTGAATRAEKDRLSRLQTTLAAVKAAADAKANAFAAIQKQLLVVQQTAAQKIALALKGVSTALTAVASSTATTTAKSDLLKVETKLVEAKATASVKADAVQAAKAKLAEANQKLALQKKVALKP